ncbi:hypothetical protein [Lactobacillus intestinalis]|uniref:hypothetical protein n=1 Tax=Lactobacillus intestinalis TaxID=151781 RepID=UPI002670042E|nr:hypothetical protein [Lactobacillus intestinalis]
MKNKSNRKRTKQNHEPFCLEDYTPAMPYAYAKRKLLDAEDQIYMMNRDIAKVEAQLANLTTKIQALKSSLQRNQQI